MRHYLGIGIRGEFVAGALQALADRLVVLDDAVMHQRQVARDMRMRIALGRRAMRRPARMRDAGLAGDVLRAGLHGELGDAAGGAHAFDAGAIYNGDAGRVVAPVFEAPQAVDQDRYDVAACRRADDAAHARSSFSSAASRTEWKPGGRAPPSAGRRACPW